MNKQADHIIDIAGKTEGILNIIRQAGKIMLRAHDMEDDGNVSAKPGTTNFVTVYDVAVQNFLIEHFSALLPDAVFFAEEKDNDADDALHAPFCFIIDPIDGTTNFIHNYRLSSISVALLSHGEVIFGAVYNPFNGELFHALRGSGAYLNERPIHVADRPLDVAVVAMGTVPYYRDTLGENTFAFARDLYFRGGDMRRLGSAALDMCGLAAGRNDVFCELMLSPWDYAAATLIVSEAGGYLTCTDGSPLRFDRPCPVLGGTPRLWDELLQMASKYV